MRIALHVGWRMRWRGGGRGKDKQKERGDLLDNFADLRLLEGDYLTRPQGRDQSVLIVRHSLELFPQEVCV